MERWKEVAGSDRGYGPSIERAQRSFPNQELDTAAEWLTPKQRRVLRNVLLALGIALSPMKDTRQTDTMYDDAESWEEAVAVAPATETAKPIDVEATSQPSMLQQRVEQFLADIHPSDIAATATMARKPVRGAEHLNRAEYLRGQLSLSWNEETSEGVPPAVQGELRRLMVGKCAQESRFDASKVNQWTGALGLLQIMPNNWERIAGDANWQSMKEQVRVVGELLTEVYDQLQALLGAGLLQELKSRFPDEETFGRELMAPLVVSGYQSGAARVAEAVRLYLTETAVEDQPSGRDLYLAVVDFAAESEEGRYLAKFGSESRDHVPKVLAFTEALQNEMAKRDQSE